MKHDKPKSVVLIHRGYEVDEDALKFSNSIVTRFVIVTPTQIRFYDVAIQKLRFSDIFQRFSTVFEYVIRCLLYSNPEVGFFLFTNLLFSPLKVLLRVDIHRIFYIINKSSHNIMGALC